MTCKLNTNTHYSFQIYQTFNSHIYETQFTVSISQVICESPSFTVTID
jgi:hypothetical protein